MSVVFHSAATLKFDEALDVAVDQNVRSVMRLMDICDKLPNVDVSHRPHYFVSFAFVRRAESRKRWFLNI